MGFLLKSNNPGVILEPWLFTDEVLVLLPKVTSLRVFGKTCSYTNGMPVLLCPVPLRTSVLSLLIFL